MTFAVVSMPRFYECYGVKSPVRGFVLLCQRVLVFAPAFTPPQYCSLPRLALIDINAAAAIAFIHQLSATLGRWTSLHHDSL